MKPAKVSIEACPHCEMPIEEARGQCHRHLPNRDKNKPRAGMPPKRTSADDFFSKWIRDRDGNKCRRCGKTEGALHCAHIFSRRYKVLRPGYRAHTGAGCCLRHDTLNAVCLCAGCHLFWAHQNPMAWADWVRQEIGEYAYETLRQQTVKTTKRVKRRDVA